MDNLNMPLPPPDPTVLETIRGLYGQTSPERGKVRPRSGDKNRLRSGSGATMNNWQKNQHNASNNQMDRFSNLNAELATLKRKLAKSADQEKQLRAMVSHLEASLASRDSELQEVARFMSAKGKEPSDTAKMAAKKLREQSKQVANVKKILKERDEQIAQLERASKVTTLREVRKEADEYLKEIQRLRLLLGMQGGNGGGDEKLLEQVSSEPVYATADFVLNEPRWDKYQRKKAPIRPNQRQKSKPQRKGRKQGSSNGSDVVYFHVSTAKGDKQYSEGPPTRAPRLSTKMVPMVSPDAESSALLTDRGIPMMVPVERTERLAKNARVRQLQAREREVAEQARKLKAEARLFQATREKWAKKRKKQARVTKKAVQARLKELSNDFEKEQQKRESLRRHKEAMTSEEGYAAARKIQKIFRGYYTRKLVEEAKEYMKRVKEEATETDEEMPSSEEIIDVLRNQLEEKNYELQEAEDRYQALEEETVLLTARCEELEQANAALGQEVDEAKYQAETDAEEKVEERNEKILELEKALALKQDRLDELTQAYKDVLKPNEDDNAKVAEMKSTIINLTLKVDMMAKLEKENAEMKQKLATANRTRTLSQQSLHDAGEDSIRIPQNRFKEGSQAKRYEADQSETNPPAPSTPDKTLGEAFDGQKETAQECLDDLKTHPSDTKTLADPESSTQEVVPQEMARIEENDSDNGEEENIGKEQAETHQGIKDSPKTEDGTQEANPQKMGCLDDGKGGSGVKESGEKEQLNENQAVVIDNSGEDVVPSEMPRPDDGDGEVEDGNDNAPEHSEKSAPGAAVIENSGEDVVPSEMPRPDDGDSEGSDSGDTTDDDDDSLHW